MDYWGNSGLPQPPLDPALNLLGEPLLLDLDDKTLQYLMGGAPGTSAALPAGSAAGAAAAAGGAQGSEGAGPSSKRLRTEDDCLASWLGAEGSGGGQDAGGDADAGGRDGEEDSGDDYCTDRKCSKRVGKQGKPMSQAALVKATREKARRERLNECFDELARLCDPSGKMVKTDRVSIVQDAIRVLQELRLQNNQLRQLNKFLEERVSGFERDRAQSMYQQVMMQQQLQQQQQHQQQQQLQQQQQQQPGAAQMLAAPSGEIQPVTALQLSQALAGPSGSAMALAGPSGSLSVPDLRSGLQLASAASGSMPPPAADAAAAAAAAAAGQSPAAAMNPATLAALPAASSPAPGQAQPGAANAHAAALGGTTVALVQIGPGGLGATQLSMLGIKQEQLAGLGMQQMLLPVGLPSTLPPNAPPVSWLPAASLDVSQDQKLRPPAA
ncbi:hypothetical protein N2152v2_006842 [Parachlorella kessleri]